MQPFRYVNKYNLHCLISASVADTVYRVQTAINTTEHTARSGTERDGKWKSPLCSGIRLKCVYSGQLSICVANAHNFNPFSVLIALTLNVIGFNEGRVRFFALPLRSVIGVPINTEQDINLRQQREIVRHGAP